MIALDIAWSFALRSIDDGFKLHHRMVRACGSLKPFEPLGAQSKRMFAALPTNREMVVKDVDATLRHEAPRSSRHPAPSARRSVL